MSDVEVLRSLPSDPRCPKCGRRYATKRRQPKHQHVEYFCDPAREIGGCGQVFTK
jgi:hypothetical protein